MPTETLAMPFRGEPRAPSFSGSDDEQLLKFFDDFEALAEECGLLENEKCRDLLRYVDFCSKRLWLTFDSYESGNYQKLKDEIVYQYPMAWKAAQRRSPPLARRCTEAEVHPLGQSVPSPLVVNDSGRAVSPPCPSELSPPAAPFRPTLAVHRPAPLACPAHAVPALIVCPADSCVDPTHAVPRPAARRAHVVSVDRHARAAPVVRNVHAAPVFCHAAPVGSHAPPIVHRADPVVGQDHTAPLPKFTFQSAAVPFVPITAPLPFPLRPDLVPAAPVTARPLPTPVTSRPHAVPAPLPFPLCPTPAPSASVTAQVQPSSVVAKCLELPPVPCDSRVCQSSEVHAPVETQESEVECLMRRGQEGAEDVAVQKEEGRGQQAVVQLSNDEAERRAIYKQQEVENRQKTIPQRLDEDEIGETADEERSRETADEDRSCVANEDQEREAADERREIVDEQKVEHESKKCWIVDEKSSRFADEEQREIEQRFQEKIEVQQKITLAKYDLGTQTDVPAVPILVPASLPASEPPPELSAKPDIVPVSLSTPERQSLPFLTIGPTHGLSPCSQHDDHPEHQHIIASPFCRLTCSRHSRSQIRYTRAHYKEERHAPVTRPSQQMPVSHYDVRRSIMEPFVPPPRKLRPRLSLACAASDDALGLWKALTELVTGNSMPAVAMFKWFQDHVVSHSYSTVRNLFTKACNSDIPQWLTFACHVYWADRTISQAMVTVSIATDILQTRSRLPFKIEDPFAIVQGLVSPGHLVSIPSFEPSSPMPSVIMKSTPENLKISSQNRNCRFPSCLRPSAFVASS